MKHLLIRDYKFNIEILNLMRAWEDTVIKAELITLFSEQHIYDEN